MPKKKDSNKVCCAKRPRTVMNEIERSMHSHNNFIHTSDGMETENMNCVAILHIIMLGSVWMSGARYYNNVLVRLRFCCYWRIFIVFPYSSRLWPLFTLFWPPLSLTRTRSVCVLRSVIRFFFRLAVATSAIVIAVQWMRPISYCMIIDFAQLLLAIMRNT